MRGSAINHSGTVDLGFVIPTHDNEAHLVELLASIERQTVRPRQIIIMDNASRDGYPDRLARQVEGAEAIRLPRNTFFARAADLGVRCCATRLVAVVNDDAVLDPDWTEVATRRLVATPEAASLASRIRQARRPDLLDSAGDHVTAEGRVGKIAYGQPTATTARQPGWVTSASGTCALYRRDRYLEAGGFPHGFRAYLEDVDLGMRLQMLGYRCVYEPEATLSHVGGATHKPRRAALRLTERNLARLVIRTFPPIELGLSLRHQLRGPANVLGGSSVGSWAVGKGVATAELPRLLRQRRRLRGRQRVSDGELARILHREFTFVGHL